MEADERRGCSDLLLPCVSDRKDLLAEVERLQGIVEKVEVWSVTAQEAREFMLNKQVVDKAQLADELVGEVTALAEEVKRWHRQGIVNCACDVCNGKIQACYDTTKEPK